MLTKEMNGKQWTQAKRERKGKGKVGEWLEETLKTRNVFWNTDATPNHPLTSYLWEQEKKDTTYPDTQMYAELHWIWKLEAGKANALLYPVATGTY